MIRVVLDTNIIISAMLQALGKRESAAEAVVSNPSDPDCAIMTLMTLVLDIEPEVQVELSRQAAARGVDLGAYAALLLEDAARMSFQQKLPSQQRLETTLRELAQFSAKIPSLPGEAFARETLYRDSD